MTQSQGLGMTPGMHGVPDEPDQLAFPPTEYAVRLTRLRALMAEQKIDLLYLTSPESVCWLHGFYASWYKAQGPMRYPNLYGTAVHVDHDALIHFDAPNELAVLARRSVCKDNRFFASREAAPNLAFIAGELRAKGWLAGTVGLEFWSYIPNRAVSTMVEGMLLAEGCRVVDASAIARRARRVKSPAEIACIEEAVRLADIGHDAVRKHARPGITELELFGEVTRAMMAAGSEFPALIPIFNAVPVVNGRSTTTGHTMAGRKILQAGEMLKADLCGVYHRYHGNVMRGYFLGDPPKQMLELHRRAAGAFDAMRTVKAGMTVREVNAVLRNYLEGVGLWDEPGWALGYELGISLPPDWVGEFYFHSRDDKYLDRVFEPSMVTNFESLFGTWLVDTCVYEKSATRFMSEQPLDLIAV
jgi:Xaa-Pro aminopeptidase